MNKAHFPHMEVRRASETALFDSRLSSRHGCRRAMQSMNEATAS
jgi:hypothetical protein